MYETGNNITRLRKINNLSIRDVQEAMGFNTPQAIYKWQRGECMPSLDNILVLSQLFNKSVEEIIAIDREV